MPWGIRPVCAGIAIAAGPAGARMAARVSGGPGSEGRPGRGTHTQTAQEFTASPGGDGCAEPRVQERVRATRVCPPPLQTVPQVCAARHGALGLAANVRAREGICAIFTDHLQAGCDLILPLRRRPPAERGSPDARHHLPPAPPRGKALPRRPPPVTPRAMWG